MAVLIAASVLIGLVYGRVPVAVAERVFAEEPMPLLRRSDALSPHRVDTAHPRAATALQLAHGALYGATAAVVGTDWVVAAHLWFVSVTLTLTLTDLDRKLIPNRILFPGFIVAAVLLAAGALLDGAVGSLGRAAAGTVGYFAFLLVLALAARGGFGMGDVKLGALLGALLAYRGWDVLVVGAVAAFVLGGVVSIVLLVLRVKGRKDAIPFGPYLVVGAYVAIAAGKELADWYVG